MQLSNFNVVHARDDASSTVLTDPLVHCHAGDQVVLAYVSRRALMDYFRVPGDRRITLGQWNLVVESNLERFKPIFEAKFECDDCEVHNAQGHSYPKLVVTLADMERSGQKFSMDVLDVDAGFRRF
jgi:hypothetical protein